MNIGSIDLRNLIALAIIAKQESNHFTFNSFDVEQVWVPYAELEDLKQNHRYGKLYLIANPFNEGANLTRKGGLALRELSVSMGFQKPSVFPSNPTEIDLLVDLIGELYDVCRHIKSLDYSWVRTETLRDDNGVPFSYISLTNHNIFEAYFTVYFNNVVS